MIEDGRDVATDQVRADVCILGAGPAGLTLAHELRGLGADVCVLESGERRPTPRGQALAGGENADPRYYRLASTRIRAFGGTSNHWRPDSGFRTRPLEALDLAARPELGRDGWPIARTELEGDYTRATDLCGLTSAAYDTPTWSRPGSAPLPLDPEVAETWAFQIGPLDAFTSRWDEFARAPDVRVLTSTTALELRTTGDTVERVVATVGGGRRLDVQADTVVLALGGLENARLLLLSRRDRPHGLGNDHDQVGRWFMEHPHVRSGVLVPGATADLRDLAMYERHDVDGADVVAMLAPSAAALLRERALGSAWSVHLVPRARVSTAGWQLSEVRDLLTYRRWLPGTGARLAALATRPATTARAVRAARSDVGADVAMLIGMTEQVPNPDSRVVLGTARDRYGQPVARLDWRLTDEDLRAIRVGQDLLGEAVEATGWGRVDDRFGDVEPSPVIGGGFHHMGTTRMHPDPQQGVVDVDQRVHGTTNLYATGTSVFTTGGVANPTLTVVALAVRLARHLRGAAAGAA